MATHATVTRKTKEGYEYIYVHFDGYINGLGEDLKDKINTDDLVRNFIKGGHCSYIGKPCGEGCAFVKKLDEIELEDYNYIWDNGWYLLEDGKLKIY